ncbi:translation initiation factor IF-2 [Desulfovibrio sp. OttesenSCG-928-I05]|nr:translation initiation factor IF-2 [Desulfovibrio sp. OttesenSCG-928-I05]
MTEEMVKVKDLAGELGVSNKDMLGALRELNIAAKSLVASIASEDASKLRAHFSAPTQESERRETKSGVIVRRRRRDAAQEASAEASDAGVDLQESAAAEPAPVVQAAGQEKADAPVAEEAAPAKRKSAKAAEAATAESGEEKKAAPKAKDAEKPKAATARIIRRPQDDVAQPEAAVAAPGEAASTVEPAQPAPQAVAEAAPAAVTEQAEAPAAKQAEATRPEQASKAPRQEKEKAESGHARVIRPAMAPNLSAEPERGADGQALSSAPGPLPRSEADGAEAAQAQPENKSQVRIISRPDPSKPRPAGRDGARDGRDSGTRDGRPFRPAGSGGPGGAGGPGGSGRPGGPGGSGGPGRSGAPGGHRPGFAAPDGPPPSGDADARKKRGGKDKRTVDFGADFGKRRQEGDEGGWNARGRRKGRKREQAKPVATQPLKAVKRKIRMEEFIRVSDLAHQMGLKAGEIIKVLFGLGVMATINQSLDIDTATLVAAEFDYEVERVGFSEEALLEEQETADSPEDMVTRPPVVTIMGHVDHGKTSLLDAIRKSSVVSGEAGGITQHIGAYHVKTKKGEIVFLDTPGHEAFTAMRARGAEVTDIVVLVVAADDGVMEQTREAISHAKAAGVPIMIAVNKMDKEEANPDRVKRELAEYGLVPEEWGGDTVYSYVSAKSRMGIDELLEMLALQAELLELKANPDKPARGHIIEARLDKGRGSLGTVLIQQGTLKVGDPFVSGVHYGRVRAMLDDQGRKVKAAGPSMPVEVQGFEGVPEAGDEFVSIPDEKVARRIADSRTMKQREKTLAKESRITLETFLSRNPDAVEAQVLNLVVKADVQGSLEAISDALNKLGTEKVRLSIIHGGVGAVSESDVLLASASEAIIIGFNVRPTPGAKELIEQEKVDIRFYDIIYKLVDEMKSAMTGMLAPISKEQYLGLAEVRELFSVPKIGVIAGCMVTDGKITRNAQVRLLRDNVVIHTGKIGSLRRFKDDAREVVKGYECGIGIDKFNDLKVGDNIEAFEIVEEAATL